MCRGHVLVCFCISWARKCGGSFWILQSFTCHYAKFHVSFHRYVGQHGNLKNTINIGYIDPSYRKVIRELQPGAWNSEPECHYHERRLTAGHTLNWCFSWLSCGLRCCHPPLASSNYRHGECPCILVRLSWVSLEKRTKYITYILFSDPSFNWHLNLKIENWPRPIPIANFYVSFSAGTSKLGTVRSYTLCLHKKQTKRFQKLDSCPNQIICQSTLHQLPNVPANFDLDNRSSAETTTKAASPPCSGKICLKFCTGPCFIEPATVQQ